MNDEKLNDCLLGEQLGPRVGPASQSIGNWHCQTSQVEQQQRQRQQEQQ